MTGMEILVDNLEKSVHDLSDKLQSDDSKMKQNYKSNSATLTDLL